MDAWYENPYLTTKDINRIAGCGAFGCWECCHKKKPGCARCFPEFPRHPTINQFFTPTMFETYHREGYRICFENEEVITKPRVKNKPPLCRLCRLQRCACEPPIRAAQEGQAGELAPDPQPNRAPNF